MTPIELFKAGKLADAVTAALAAVKTAPADRGKRYMLAEFLLFAGDLDRADKQLDVLDQPQAPEGLAVVQFRHLVRAEQARRDVFDQGRVPDLLAAPSEAVELTLKAAVAARAGSAAEAADFLKQAEAARPPAPGDADGAAFDDFRDLDDRLGPVLEVLATTGKYYWVPVNQVESVEFSAPERPRDLFWRPARLIVRDGPDGEVYVPTLYPGSHLATDEAVKLGRYTDWQGGDGHPYRGFGLREFLVGDESKPILQLKTVTFAPPVGT
jgi:type VI secretion system protein ImpE